MLPNSLLYISNTLLVLWSLCEIIRNSYIRAGKYLPKKTIWYSHLLLPADPHIIVPPGDHPLCHPSLHEILINEVVDQSFVTLIILQTFGLLPDVLQTFPDQVTVNHSQEIKKRQKKMQKFILEPPLLHLAPQSLLEVKPTQHINLNVRPLPVHCIDDCVLEIMHHAVDVQLDP